MILHSQLVPLLHVVLITLLPVFSLAQNMVYHPSGLQLKFSHCSFKLPLTVSSLPWSSISTIQSQGHSTRVTSFLEQILLLGTNFSFS